MHVSPPFMWWGCCGLCFWHKLTELAYSFLFCSCVYLCLFGPFNCISFHKFSRHLSAFSLCSSGLISALTVLSAIYLCMKVSFSPDIILCGWLGLKRKPRSMQVLNMYKFCPFYEEPILLPARNLTKWWRFTGPLSCLKVKGTSPNVHVLHQAVQQLSLWPRTVLIAVKHKRHVIHF